MALKTDDIISDIREFNRFYTNVLGLLGRNLLNSDYSLTEARVLFEINKRTDCSANTLARELSIDRSYMSRIILKFEKKGLITKTESAIDNRVKYIQLTLKGKKELAVLNDKASEQIKTIIKPLDSNARIQVCGAMNTIRRHLLMVAQSAVIRPFKEKDIEQVISRHKSLYENEYGLSSKAFKAYIDKGVHHFTQHFDMQKDNMFIFELNKNYAGSIAVAHTDQGSAQIRYFLLDPEVRGLGVGHKLIDKALNFSISAGYKHIFLWTISRLNAARHLYEKKGFVQTQTIDHKDWGTAVTEERWDLELVKRKKNNECEA